MLKILSKPWTSLHCELNETEYSEILTFWLKKKSYKSILHFPEPTYDVNKNLRFD